MTALLTALGTVFDWILSRFTNVLTLYATEPLLQLLLGIMIVGAIIGLGMRLVHRT